MKTTYHNRIHYYMTEKSKLIAEHVDTDTYYLEADADWVFGLSEAEAERVWDIMFLWSRDECGSMSKFGCPFCIVHTMNCDACGYGKRHGKCRSLTTDNTYGKIARSKEMTKLDNKFFLKTIKKAEEIFQ